MLNFRINIDDVAGAELYMGFVCNHLTLPKAWEGKYRQHQSVSGHLISFEDGTPKSVLLETADEFRIRKIEISPNYDLTQEENHV